MDDKRRFKRIPLKIELTISKLFKQDYEEIPDVNATVEVNNISKSGIGFVSNDELPLNYYFDAKISLPDDNYFYSVLKVIRVEKAEEKYYIGSEFVGLSEIVSDKIYSSDKDQSESLIPEQV